MSQSTSNPACRRAVWTLLAALCTACGCAPREDGKAAGPPPTPPEHAAGQAVYESGCASCHDSSRDGAPRLGYLPAWEKRLAKGPDALLTSVLDGEGLMPPRGDLEDVTDEQLRQAVGYMSYRAELNIPAGH